MYFYHLKDQGMEMRAHSLLWIFPCKPHLFFEIYLHAVCALGQMAGVLWFCSFRMNRKTERHSVYAFMWMHAFTHLKSLQLIQLGVFYILVSPRDYCLFFYTHRVSSAHGSSTCNIFISLTCTHLQYILKQYEEKLLVYNYSCGQTQINVFVIFILILI